MSSSKATDARCEMQLIIDTYMESLSTTLSGPPSVIAHRGEPRHLSLSPSGAASIMRRNIVQNADWVGFSSGDETIRPHSDDIQSRQGEDSKSEAGEPVKEYQPNDRYEPFHHSEDFSDDDRDSIPYDFDPSNGFK